MLIPLVRRPEKFFCCYSSHLADPQRADDLLPVTVGGVVVADKLRGAWRMALHLDEDGWFLKGPRGDERLETFVFIDHVAAIDLYTELQRPADEVFRHVQRAIAFSSEERLPHVAVPDGLSPGSRYLRRAGVRVRGVWPKKEPQGQGDVSAVIPPTPSSIIGSCGVDLSCEDCVGEGGSPCDDES